ncbi:MAG: hypothetical protein BZY83_06260 [SAR202 cluster bacterium Casp-Chloro-G2]|nr:MAG: hypothetical protein BZY83_06260 [SAR202 cluster bacterium Casp-Chloro-G2]
MIQTSINRKTLSKPQMALFIAVGVLALVTQAAVLRVYFTSGNVTRSVENRSLSTTGLAKVQREALLLNVEAGKVLRDPNYSGDVLAFHRAMLGDELRLQGARFTDPELKARLDEIALTLVRYDAMMAGRLNTSAPADAIETEGFDAVLTDLRQQIIMLYDDEEQSFYWALSQNLRSNQKLHIILMVLSGLVILGGGLLGASLRRTVWALRDEMKQRDKVECDLADANEQLVRSERLVAIGKWSGGVAHDLRNPLGAIKNSAYLLKRKLSSDGAVEANPKLGQYLEIIEQQVNRSTSIISDLLTFSGVAAPALEELQVDKVLEDSLETMVKNDHIVLRSKIAPNLHSIRADAEQLQRVFLNLANNAQEAMPEGGRLDISIANADDQVVIAFSDTGQGISDENIGKIFDPLFTTKTKGTGLGLAVCQEIIMRHGGTIGACRNRGPSGGSVFEVRLPDAAGTHRDAED